MSMAVAAKTRDDYVTITENITFFPDGSSQHVWSKDGEPFKTERFDVSPILFIKRGDEFGFDTAKERGITTITRTVRQ